MAIKEDSFGGSPMRFDPYIISGANGEKVRVSVTIASGDDLNSMRIAPEWQTDWTLLTRKSKSMR